ncbi:MAG: radical SAM protein [Omnitrophica bacterium]|nr:radical SAM protein [Candidatus Omnitrophota bacterium]
MIAEFQREPIDIFVICYEPTPLLEKCLESIQEHTANIPHRVIVIEGKRSAAENRNIALSQVVSSWFVTVDDDIEVTSGWLDKMLSCAKDDIGQIQAKLITPQKKIFAAEMVFTAPWGDDKVVAQGQEDKGQCNYVRTVELLSGTCCLYNKKILQYCSFDSNYKGSQCEDSDFSLQIRRNGFRLLYCGESEVYHHHLFRKPVYSNFNYFKNKWFGERKLTRRGVLYVGFACDINCVFCYYRFAHTKKFKAIKELREECDRFKKFYSNSHVDITGGEPTIYPQIVKLVEHCNKIALKPTIITHGQRLTKELVKSLKQAGIEDFLVSYHGLQPEHDYLVDKTGGYKAMRVGIQNIIESGLSFRTNTVVTEVNYKNLPVLANEFLGIKPKVVNLIMFNPFEGWVDIDRKNFQAKYRKAASYLTEAISMLTSKKIETHLRYAPFCLFPGLEAYIMNFPQLPFDKWEWDSKAGHTLQGEYDYLHYALGASRERYDYPPPCQRCSLQLICSGIPKQYNREFGYGELKPRGGMLIRDPLYFNTLKHNPTIENRYYKENNLVYTPNYFITTYPYLKNSDPLLLHKVEPLSSIKPLRKRRKLGSRNVTQRFIREARIKQLHLLIPPHMVKWRYHQRMLWLLWKHDRVEIPIYILQQLYKKLKKMLKKLFS